jgi:hypothetical protein
MFKLIIIWIFTCEHCYNIIYNNIIFMVLLIDNPLRYNIKHIMKQPVHKLMTKGKPNWSQLLWNFDTTNRFIQLGPLFPLAHSPAKLLNIWDPLLLSKPLLSLIDFHSKLFPVQETSKWSNLVSKILGICWNFL